MKKKIIIVLTVLLVGIIFLLSLVSLNYFKEKKINNLLTKYIMSDNIQDKYSFLENILKITKNNSDLYYQGYLLTDNLDKKLDYLKKSIFLDNNNFSRNEEVINFIYQNSISDGFKILEEIYNFHKKLKSIPVVLAYYSDIITNRPATLEGFVISKNLELKYKYKEKFKLELFKIIIDNIKPYYNKDNFISRKEIFKNVELAIFNEVFKALDSENYDIYCEAIYEVLFDENLYGNIFSDSFQDRDGIRIVTYNYNNNNSSYYLNKTEYIKKRLQNCLNNSLFIIVSQKFSLDDQRFFLASNIVKQKKFLDLVINSLENSYLPEISSIDNIMIIKNIYNLIAQDLTSAEKKYFVRVWDNSFEEGNKIVVPHSLYVFGILLSLSSEVYLNNQNSDKSVENFTRFSRNLRKTDRYEDFAKFIFQNVYTDVADNNIKSEIEKNTGLGMKKIKENLSEIGIVF